MSLPRKFLNRPSSDRLLVLEALAWLIWARLLVWVVPFRRIARKLGGHMSETSLEDLSVTDDQTALRISWAVEMSAHYFPLSLVCLPQAMSAKWMLRRRRVPNTLYLGIRSDPKKPGHMLAHAWLRCGPRVLTGRQNLQGYTIISTFGDLP